MLYISTKACYQSKGSPCTFAEAGISLSVHANLNDRREAHKNGFDVSDANATKKIVEREDLGRFGIT